MAKHLFRKFPFTQNYLRERMHYNKNTGVFTWRWHPDMPPHWNTRWSGKTAGNIDPDGYVKISIDNKTYFAHRLAWFYVHGEQPAEIDHDDQCRDNNRLINLRPANRNQNQHNKTAYKNNVSSLKGVYWESAKNKWRAQIQVYGRKIHIGYFDVAEDAGEAYHRAAKKFHGEFARCRASRKRNFKYTRPMSPPRQARRLKLSAKTMRLR